MNSRLALSSGLLLAIVVALASRGSVAANEVRHLELNGAHLIDTSQNNYALADQTLLQNQWKTVSVNGNNVVIIAPNCQSTLKNVQALTAVEKQAIENARSKLAASENNNQQIMPTNNGQQQYKFGLSRYSLDSGTSKMYSSRGMNVNFSSFNYNGMSIVKTDENNFSASKPNMPNNLARIFVNNDLATYVYQNGEVQMKPTACLQPAELQLNQQIKSEIQQAQQKFDQDMQQFQRNMQQNMQNMQQNLQNMFGNGFPFNNMAQNNQMMGQMMGQNGLGSMNQGSSMWNGNGMMNGASNMMTNGNSMMSNGNNMMTNGNGMMSNGNNNMMTNGNSMMSNGNNNMMSNGIMQQMRQPFNMQSSFNMNPFGSGFPFASTGINFGTGFPFNG